MKYVYKVTTKEGKSVCSVYIDYLSKYSLTYKIGRKTIPKIGKIFVFKTLKHTEDFRDTLQKIFRCTYQGYATQQDFRATFYPDKFKKFWEEYQKDHKTVIRWGWRSTPIGTFSVKSLTPIEEVKSLD